MNKENKIIICNKYINSNSTELHLSQTEKRVLKWMVKRIQNDGLFIKLEDLSQFVRSDSNQQVVNNNNNKNAERQLVKRLVKKDAIISVKKGVYVPTQYENIVKDNNINLQLLAKIKNRNHKKNIIQTQKQFLNLIRPYLTNKQNKWSRLATHGITAKFYVNGLYENLINLNGKSPNKYFILPVQDKRIPNLKAAFHIYPNYVKLKVGTTNMPIQASESIISSALSICHNYLLYIIKNWNLDLRSLPQYDSWLITIPYLYCKTVNEDYTSFGYVIRDNDFGLELTDYNKGINKYLRLKILLPPIQLKPSELASFFDQYNPLKFLNLDPKKMLNFYAYFDTFSKSYVSSQFSEIEKEEMNKEK
jgi:hypothetical protein